MQKLYSALLSLITLVSGAQVCNSSGNVMLFTNYDGGTLTINVDQNISNLKIGICSYEACQVNLVGSFLTNVTEVHYAGFNNSNNSTCNSSSPISTTTITGAPSSATTSISFAPTATLSNSNGYGSIICGYSCNNTTSQGGCNTVDQIEAYFLGHFSGSSLYAHKVQYGCWTGTQSLSLGGNCCPPPPVYGGSITASQTICAGQIPNSFLSSISASVAAGTITFQWESSTTSTNSGFASIPSATSSTFAAGAVSQTTYYRRAASTSTNNAGYSNVLTITVLPLPVISISGATTVCAGSSTTLSATGGTSYLWSPGGSTSSTTVITPSLSTLVTLTCFPANGCSVAATIPILVNPQPTVNVTLFTGNASNPTSICFGQTATLTAAGAATYSWEPGNLAGVTVTVSPSSTTIYTLTGENNMGCKSILVTFVIQVDPLPVIAIATSPAIVCEGTPNVLTGSGAISYTWMPMNVTNVSVSVLPTVTTIYTVTGSDGVCSDDVFVILAPLLSPTVLTGSLRQSLCKGESTFITVAGASTYTLQNSNMTIVSNSIAVSPTVTTNFTVTGSGSNGCTRSAIQTITVSACTDVMDQALNPERKIKVYPNPSNGEFYLESKMTQSFNLISNNGQIVTHMELSTKNEYKISISGIAPGIYFIIADDLSFRQKIIVMGMN